MVSQTKSDLPTAESVAALDAEADNLPWQGPNAQSFSWAWVALSVAVFIALEVGLGYYAGRYLLANYVSMNLRYMVEGGLNLVSYFLGGFLIGVFSPRIRMLEPAVGAFLAVLATLSVGLLTPMTLFQFQLSKLVLGGVLAFVFALWGAQLGEKLTRQIPR